MRYPQQLFSTLADKVEARNYIARVVGEKYLVPALLVCERVTPDIFERLPVSFVMKANHSAGQVKIVTNKSTENLAELSALANAWLCSDFSETANEKHYRDIKPKIIFEQALLSGGQPPADYKFNVFNPKDGSEPYIFIQHIQDRLGKTTQNLYLEDWSPAPFARSGQTAGSEKTERPAALAEMIDVAKRISAPFGYLRVDFYLHDGHIYIGELTLTPAGGNYSFSPPEWDELLGEKFGWPENLHDT